MAKIQPFDPDPIVTSTPSNGGRRVSHASNEHRAGKRRLSPVDKASGLRRFVLILRHSLRTLFLKSGWWDSDLAATIRKFLRGRLVSLITMIALFVALFLAEIFSVAQVPTNTALDVALCLVFAIFALEFIGLATTDISYIFGFFFWMDLLGTASMAFDISFLAGSDVTQANYVNQDGESTNNLIVVRATRAAKLGSRAGRITRVLKILRYLPFLLRSDEDIKKVKMAKVISNQLTNGLSTRVAFLTIALVVILPLFTMFTYPEVEDSMAAWTEVLAYDAKDLYDGWLEGNATQVELMTERLVASAVRMRDFYRDISHGPFLVEFGVAGSGESFAALPSLVDLGQRVNWTFSEPARMSSCRVVTNVNIRALFDMSTPRQQEAACNLGLIVFIILTMCCFGLLMSSSISVLAVQPLERMLAGVRERCAQIFKYTDDLKEDDKDDADEKSEYDDVEHDSEFVLLEKVVAKLAAIADLTTTKTVEVTANMTEVELMQLGWMQGSTIPSSSSFAGAARRGSLMMKRVPETPEGDHGRARRASVHILPNAIMETLHGPDFNALDLSKELRIVAASFLMWDASGDASTWARDTMDEKTLQAFVKEVEAGYHQNAFHNFAHGLDVQYVVFWYMSLICADKFLGEALRFALLVAALGHDIGHPGVNNQFLIEMSDELAVRYNDRSPLEMMHCARLFHVLTRTETALFEKVEKELYKELRKCIIHAILHTDVTKHNEMIKELGILYQMNSDALDALNPELAIQSNGQISLIAGMLLHGADISNPAKPWDLCRRLAKLCVDEFFAQGDLEKEAGIPIQMLNDREKVNLANSQIGFIEFFIAPIVTEMVNLFPPLHPVASQLGLNITTWSEVWQEETTPAPDAVSKVNARVKKVSGSLSELSQRAAAYVEAAESAL